MKLPSDRSYSSAEQLNISVSSTSKSGGCNLFTFVHKTTKSVIISLVEHLKYHVSYSD